MDITKYKKEIFAFGVALIAISLLLILQKTENRVTEEFFVWNSGEKVLSLEIADTNRERMEGLSGRQSLPKGSALLLVFKQEDEHGIWMKDMLFPIDVIWLDPDFEVVNFKSNVLPETYPTVFKPERPALYVLETNVGFIDQYRVKIGQQLDLRREDKI